MREALPTFEAGGKPSKAAFGVSQLKRSSRLIFPIVLVIDSKGSQHKLFMMAFRSGLFCHRDALFTSNGQSSITSTTTRTRTIGEQTPRATPQQPGTACLTYAPPECAQTSSLYVKPKSGDALMRNLVVFAPTDPFPGNFVRAAGENLASLR